MENVLLPSEIELYIDTMSPQNIVSVGTKQWMDWHQRLQKLNQQALLEASQLKEEQVKETLITFQKLPVLVHEAILINMWKFKVLPRLLQLDPEPEQTFVAYSILYHEAVCVALLELVMFHANCCEALEDAAPDLLDYVSGCVARLVSLERKEGNVMEPSGEELQRQADDLSFDIGIRCLSILRYLAENLDRFPIGVASKMYDSYDVPMLLAQILNVRPWTHQGKLYKGGKWIQWDGEAIGQAEAQVWLALRQLLLDPLCREYYTITETRRNQLVKLVMMLSPLILDQLSPLIELKQFLSHVSMIDQVAKGPKPILLEPILEMKENILKQSSGKWKKLAKQQLPIIFSRDHKALMETAQMLSEAYNTDLIEKLEVKEKAKCEQCGNDAIQRCSRCKKVWYCSRSCQVTHWGQHKEACNKENE